MQETSERLNLNRFFKGVFGRTSLSSTKEEVLERILKKEKLNVKEMLFVGDAEGDYNAAKNIGCNFIGVANNWNKWKKREFPLIKSISELQN